MKHVFCGGILEFFYGAFEGNGFYKLTKCLLKNPPVVEGNFCWKDYEK